ncbi:DUF6207 family protein [Streptomyces platensis]|uniref:DUF6207 family protein n=1 Tax=Streptomyces platensis TaxID=58346 RepID=UPI0036BA3B73
MKISEEHLSEPGLVVIDITAADEATATEAAAALSGLWLSSGASAPWRTPGEAGVTVRAYADLRRTPLTGGSWPRHLLKTPSPTVPQGRVATASTPALRSLRARYSTSGSVPE